MKNGKLKQYLDSMWYGMGAVGLDLSYGMFYSFLMKYLTDAIKLPIMFLIILTPLARIWDGINDPMMGSIVDNTKTKFGKYRPWVLIGSVSNAIVLFLLFTSFGLKGVPLYIYITVLYIAWGMTNTMADISYWSMVPSFTSDPEKRSVISTVARAFSGLGQGIVLIGAPIALKAFTANYEETETYDAKSFSIVAAICAVCLVVFSLISMLHVRETQSVKPSGEKFSFSKVFKVFKGNDQLRAFILFAMLSNTGYYMVSGVAVYFYDYVVGDAAKQSNFSTFGAVGSILGLLFLPIMMNFTSRRRTYQASLLMIIGGYVGMFLSFQFANNLMLMNLFYLISSIGSGSMFVSQTVFLADIVDYGEVKMGTRNESVTFSMKGFLQKMAYTIQVIILLGGLGKNYSLVVQDLPGADLNRVNIAIKLMMLVIPAIFFVASLLVFTFKFKLHGEFMENITAQVTKNREENAE